MNPCSKLGLGTVQWGMKYGIANRFGCPEADEVAQMLRLARQSGITLLDTAHFYGNAESVIGQNGEALHEWRIVTKILPTQFEDFDDQEASALSDAFHESIRKLSCSKVFGLLVHHAENLLSRGGPRLWGALQELKLQALVSKIGVSVYDPDQLSRILDNYAIDIVQLPLNLYDQRFLHTGLLDRLRLEGVEIHVRSAFLQGLLLLPAADLPEQFSVIRSHHRRLHHEFEISGISPLEGCLQFSLGQSKIDQVIIGCETKGQLEEILNASSTDSACLQNPELFAVEDVSVIDPRRWPK